MIRAENYIGRIIAPNHEDKPGGWLVDEARATRVQMCLDYIDRRVDDLKKEFGTSCLLTSAKTGENVEKAFFKITELLLSKTKEGYDG